MKRILLSSGKELLERRLSSSKTEYVDVGTGKLVEVHPKELEGVIHKPQKFRPLGPWKPFSLRTLDDLRNLRELRTKTAFKPGKSKKPKDPSEVKVPRTSKGKGKGKKIPSELLAKLRTLPLPMRKALADAGGYTLPPELLN